MAYALQKAVGELVQDSPILLSRAASIKAVSSGEAESAIHEQFIDPRIYKAAARLIEWDKKNLLPKSGETEGTVVDEQGKPYDVLRGINDNVLNIGPLQSVAEETSSIQEEFQSLADFAVVKGAEVAHQCDRQAPMRGRIVIARQEPEATDGSILMAVVRVNSVRVLAEDAVRAEIQYTPSGTRTSVAKNMTMNEILDAGKREPEVYIVFEIVAADSLKGMTTIDAGMINLAQAVAGMSVDGADMKVLENAIAEGTIAPDSMALINSIAELRQLIDAARTPGAVENVAAQIADLRGQIEALSQQITATAPLPAVLEAATAQVFQSLDTVGFDSPVLEAALPSAIVPDSVADHIIAPSDIDAMTVVADNDNRAVLPDAVPSDDADIEMSMADAVVSDISVPDSTVSETAMADVISVEAAAPDAAVIAGTTIAEPAVAEVAVPDTAVPASAVVGVNAVEAGAVESPAEAVMPEGAVSDVPVSEIASVTVSAAPPLSEAAPSDIRPEAVSDAASKAVASDVAVPETGTLETVAPENVTSAEIMVPGTQDTNAAVSAAVVAEASPPDMNAPSAVVAVVVSEGTTISPSTMSAENIAPEIKDVRAAAPADNVAPAVAPDVTIPSAAAAVNNPVPEISPDMPTAKIETSAAAAIPTTDGSVVSQEPASKIAVSTTGTPDVTTFETSPVDGGTIPVQQTATVTEGAVTTTPEVIAPAQQEASKATVPAAVSETESSIPTKADGAAPTTAPAESGSTPVAPVSEITSTKIETLSPSKVDAVVTDGAAVAAPQTPTPAPVGDATGSKEIPHTVAPGAMLDTTATEGSKLQGATPTPAPAPAVPAQPVSTQSEPSLPRAEAPSSISPDTAANEPAKPSVPPEPSLTETDPPSRSITQEAAGGPIARIENPAAEPAKVTGPSADALNTRDNPASETPRQAMPVGEAERNVQTPGTVVPDVAPVAPAAKGADVVIPAADSPSPVNRATHTPPADANLPDPSAKAPVSPTGSAPSQAEGPAPTVPHVLNPPASSDAPPAVKVPSADPSVSPPTVATATTPAPAAAPSTPTFTNTNGQEATPTVLAKGGQPAEPLPSQPSPGPAAAQAPVAPVAGQSTLNRSGTDVGASPPGGSKVDLVDRPGKSPAPAPSDKSGPAVAVSPVATPIPRSPSPSSNTNPVPSPAPERTGNPDSPRVSSVKAPPVDNAPVVPFPARNPNNNPGNPPPPSPTGDFRRSADPLPSNVVPFRQPSQDPNPVKHAGAQPSPAESSGPTPSPKEPVIVPVGNVRPVIEILKREAEAHPENPAYSKALKEWEENGSFTKGTLDDVARNLPEPDRVVMGESLRDKERPAVNNPGLDPSLKDSEEGLCATFKIVCRDRDCAKCPMATAAVEAITDFEKMELDKRNSEISKFSLSMS